MPLAAYLKNYFSNYKKYGSTDRKQITHLCFCYFRIGNLILDKSVENQLMIAYFLCNQYNDNYAFLFDEKWLNAWKNSIEKRVDFLKERHLIEDITDILSLKNEIADEINAHEFAVSHLVQPKVFVRIRPNKKSKVIETLQSQSIDFTIVSDDCIMFENNIKLDEYLFLNKDVVIQDFSSQQIAYFFQYIKNKCKQELKVWDCCAASGGKSILAIDVFSSINLTVSDIRESIIKNLRKRFDEAGISKFQSFVSDVSKPRSTHQKFNFIICDAPCSGSGTWARTPENISFFNEQKLIEFQNLQKNICNHTIQMLQQNGYFLYITCSIFRKENEEVIEYILQQHKNIRLVEKKYFLGYTHKADSMFAALLVSD